MRINILKYYCTDLRYVRFSFSAVRWYSFPLSSGIVQMGGKWELSDAVLSRNNRSAVDRTLVIFRNSGRYRFSRFSIFKHHNMG